MGCRSEARGSRRNKHPSPVPVRPNHEEKQVPEQFWCFLPTRSPLKKGETTPSSRSQLSFKSWCTDSFRPSEPFSKNRTWHIHHPVRSQLTQHLGFDVELGLCHSLETTRSNLGAGFYWKTAWIRETERTPSFRRGQKMFKLFKTTNYSSDQALYLQEAKLGLTTTHPSEPSSETNQKDWHSHQKLLQTSPLPFRRSRHSQETKIRMRRLPA